MSTVFPSSMPHDSVTIIDQSGYVEETVVESPFIPDGPVAFIPFISPRGYGDDNKLQYMSGSKLSKYGNPNLKKYGLSLYLAKQVINAGGTVLGMRVTTDSYNYANFCVYANVSKAIQVKYQTMYNSINGATTLHPVFVLNGTEYTFDAITINNPSDITTIADVDGKVIASGTTVTIKVNGVATDATLTITAGDTPSASIAVTDGDTYTVVTGNALTVQYAVENATNANSHAAISGEMIKNYAAPADDWNGSSIKIPLFYVSAKGAGLFGNAFKGRFTVDDAMNSYADMTGGDAFFYKFIDSDNNAKLDDAIAFTFNDDYVYNSECMSVEEAFAKYTENVTMAKVKGFDDFIKLVAKECCDASNASHKIKDVNLVDILFGSNMDPSVYYVDTINGKNLSISTGIQFAGGAEETSEFKFDSDPFASVLAKAYNGEISDLIYDHVRYPFQFLFCPSADGDVTSAVHNLATINRKCTSAFYFICGKNGTVVPATYADARAAKSDCPANTYKEFMVPEWARITDPYTGKKTFMPSVYFNAFSVINHWNKRKGKPLAGRLNAIWTGFDVGTVTPASSNTNEYVLNHNVGLNTMIEDGIGNAELYEQISAQATTSALSEMNNVLVLHEMVKIALRLAKENRWSDLGEEDISTYKSNVESEISDALKGCYERMEVLATRESANGAGRNRILCKINVKFKDIFKGVSYEFYILAQ